MSSKIFDNRSNYTDSICNMYNNCLEISNIRILYGIINNPISMMPQTYKSYFYYSEFSDIAIKTIDREFKGHKAALRYSS